MTFRLWRCFSAGGTPRWSSSAEPNIPGYFPQAWGLVQGSSADSRTELASQKNVSSKQRKSFRRSVLHRAALAAPSLPPPKNGSLRQAAEACVLRLQAVPVWPVSTPSAKNAPSLSLQFPLLPQPFIPWHKGLGLTLKLWKVKLNPHGRRFSRVPLSLRNPLLLFRPVRRASLRPHLWCHQR